MLEHTVFALSDSLPFFSIADDNAPSQQLVLSEEESKTCTAAEDVSGFTVASSSTHM